MTLVGQTSKRRVVLGKTNIKKNIRKQITPTKCLNYGQVNSKSSIEDSITWLWRLNIWHVSETNQVLEFHCKDVCIGPILHLSAKKKLWLFYFQIKFKVEIQSNTKNYIYTVDNYTMLPAAIHSINSATKKKEKK